MDGRFIIVKRLIDAWDPFSLLSAQAPEDEYDSESSAIAAQVTQNSSIAEIAQIISDVFSRSFGEPEYFAIDRCRTIAIALKNDIQGMED